MYLHLVHQRVFMVELSARKPGGQSDNNSTLAINPDGLTERIGPLVTSAADENIIPSFSPTLSSDIIER